MSHKVNTPIVAKYSRQYTRLQDTKAIKEGKRELAKKGMKVETTKVKGKLVQRMVQILKPFRKEAK